MGIKIGWDQNLNHFTMLLPRIVVEVVDVCFYGGTLDL